MPLITNIIKKRTKVSGYKGNCNAETFTTNNNILVIRTFAIGQNGTNEPKQNLYLTKNMAKKFKKILEEYINSQEHYEIQ